jgi:hypothetical protein
VTRHGIRNDELAEIEDRAGLALSVENGSDPQEAIRAVRGLLHHLEFIASVQADVLRLVEEVRLLQAEVRRLGGDPRTLDS